MYFILTCTTQSGAQIEIVPIDPQLPAADCDRLGIDTSEWYGKANCVVVRRGVHPSYGHFLINAVDAEKIKENEVRSIDVTIEVVDSDSEGNDVIENNNLADMYIYSLHEASPSYEGAGSFYMLTVVDARAFIPGVEMGLGHTSSQERTRQYINEVLCYDPDQGGFVYDAQSTKKYDDQSDTEGTSTTPLGWKDTLETILIISGGGLFTDALGVRYPDVHIGNTFGIEVYGVTFPSDPPENIYIGPGANIADTLYKLLFVLDADLIYQGNGQFDLIQIRDEHEVPSGDDVSQFEIKMQFDEYFKDYLEYTDLKLMKLRDKRFFLYSEEGINELPYGIVTYAQWVPTEDKGGDYVTYKQEYIPLFTDKKIGPGIRRVHIPVMWSQGREQSTDPNVWYQNLWSYKNYGRFWQYPRREVTLNGFVDIKLGTFVERISWFCLGGNEGGTLIENILPIDWDKLSPPEMGKDGVDIIYGKVKSTFTASTTSFQINSIKLVTGCDPRKDIFSADESVTVNNTTKGEGQKDSLVYAIKNQHTYKWELLSSAGSSTPPTGGGTTTPSGVVQFRLLENLNRSDYNAKAILIDELGRGVDEDGKPVLDPDAIPDWTPAEEVFEGDIRVATAGDPIGTPPAWDQGDYIKSKSANPRTTNDTFDSNEAQYWEATELPIAVEVFVVNPDSKFYGYRAYTDLNYGDQVGYIGTAFKLPRETVSNNFDAGSTGDWDLSGIPVWEPNHAYLDNDIVTVPPFMGDDEYAYANTSYRAGDPIYARKNHTSNNEFDWDEAQKWLRVKNPTDLPSAAGGGTGTIDGAGGSKKVAYQIVEMEAEARWVEGTVLTGSTKYTSSGELLPDADKEHWECYITVDTYWGAAPNNRPPRSVIVYEDMYTSTEEVTITDSQRKPSPDPGIERTELGVGIRVISRLGELGVGAGVRCRAVYDDLARCYVMDQVGTVRPVVMVGARYFNSDGTPSDAEPRKDMIAATHWDPSEEHLTLTHQRTKYDFNAYELVGDLRAGKEGGYTVGNKIWVDSMLTIPLTVPNGKGIIGFVVNNTLVGLDPYEIDFPQNDQVEG